MQAVERFCELCGEDDVRALRIECDDACASVDAATRNVYERLPTCKSASADEMLAMTVFNDQCVKLRMALEDIASAYEEFLVMERRLHSARKSFDEAGKATNGL
jgi:hypothetical protein